MENVVQYGVHERKILKLLGLRCNFFNHQIYGRIKFHKSFEKILQLNTGKISSDKGILGGKNF